MRQRWWLLSSVLVATLSFLTLRFMIKDIWPNPEVVFAQSQLLLLAMLFLGLIAISIPFSLYFNNRFAKQGWLDRDKGRLLREGAWVGLFGVLLAYLQLLKALNWTIALVLVGVFIFIEAFFLTRE